MRRNIGTSVERRRAYRSKAWGIDVYRRQDCRFPLQSELNYRRQMSPPDIIVGCTIKQAAITAINTIIDSAIIDLLLVILFI